ncbi:MAG: hypothetical protein KDD26_02855 [Winogradskyella sp.]|nr:hypothetical protein [Winogradskyella sp.]
MKFSFLNRTTAVALSFLVLFSTLSITIEKHFCGDTLVDVSVFSKVDSCCGGANDSDMPEVAKKSCCKNEVDIVEGQDNLALKTYDDLDKTQKQVLFAFAYSFIKLYESTPKVTVPHRYYSPPTIVRDIHVLDETYLI